MRRRGGAAASGVVAWARLARAAARAPQLRVLFSDRALAVALALALGEGRALERFESLVLRLQLLARALELLLDGGLGAARLAELAAHRLELLALRLELLLRRREPRGRPLLVGLRGAQVLLERRDPRAHLVVGAAAAAGAAEAALEHEALRVLHLLALLAQRLVPLGELGLELARLGARLFRRQLFILQVLAEVGELLLELAGARGARGLRTLGVRRLGLHARLHDAEQPRELRGGRRVAHLERGKLGRELAQQLELIRLAALG